MALPSTASAGASAGTSVAALVRTRAACVMVATLARPTMMWVTMTAGTASPNAM